MIGRKSGRGHASREDDTCQTYVGHVATKARPTIPAPRARDKGGRRATRGDPKISYKRAAVGLKYVHQFDQILTNQLSPISVSFHNTPKP
ncbi:hypothetical protein HanRHA438_Chr15g0694641 [Helianthus annuus]|nr:hypothetical protein HanRHA438_Chr15g0694641 [Helianthus annuus]